VTLNVNNDHLYAPSFGIGRTRGALILHELGHVKDPNEIMTEFSTFLKHPARYGPGVLG
jgi:hypothetical protein